MLSDDDLDNDRSAFPRTQRNPRNYRPPRAGTQSMMLPPRRPSIGDASDEDQSDAAAISSKTPYNMNQSLYQLIQQTAAVGLRGGNWRHSHRGRGDSEEEEEEGDEDDKGKGKERPAPTKLTKTWGSALNRIEEKDLQDSEERGWQKHGPAPYMSQVLEHQKSEFQTAQNSRSDIRDAPERTMDLAKKVMEIFSLPQEEKVEAEYPCMLMSLESIFLQGHLYITAYHICFYAYLPKRTNVNLKTGYLSKRGKSNVKFTRYWFELKGHVLTYFADPSERYFLNGHIDLRYGIQASLVDAGKDGKESKDPTAFIITTDQRKLYFRADTVTSAKEWVKAIQKAIFRTRNEGDSVKICIPTSSVMAVEDIPLPGAQKTIRLNVVDSDDTYTIDDYYFGFNEYGTTALRVLQSAVEGCAASRLPEYLRDSTGSIGSCVSRDMSQRENVRATLSPRSPTGSARGSPRVSGEYTRSSFDPARRNDFGGPLKRKQGHNRIFSTDSTELSYGEAESSRTTDDEDHSQSGSQILSGSDLFHSPTMKLNRLSLSRKKASAQDKDTSPSATIRIQPPTRQQTHHGDQDSGSEPNSPVGANKTTGIYPIAKATEWAGWMKRRSVKVGSILTSQPMGYLEKVTDMLSGGKTHQQPMGMMPHEKVDDEEQGEGELSPEDHSARFRNSFAMPENEKLCAVYYGYLHRTVPLYGKIYLSERNFCFRCVYPGIKTKMILPLKDIESVKRNKGFRFGYSGMIITIRGHEEIFFEFGQANARNECTNIMMENLDELRHMAESGFLSRGEYEDAESAKKEHQMLQEAHGYGNMTNSGYSTASRTSNSPVIFDDTHGSIIDFQPEPMKITCLTIGSRGDVQPFIALCLGLKKDGHSVKIATHAEFRNFVESHGIEFAEVAGDPAELMQLCVEHGMFTPEFLRQTHTTMRSWLDKLLETSWEAAQGSDLLIESPSCMGGVHIAEALHIPYFRAFTMPWTRTRAYPHAFAVPERKMGGAFNYLTYTVIDRVFWGATAGQINRWRKNMLGLRSTDLSKLQLNKVPFLYNFSPNVVSPPIDYPDWVRVTGYWFLDNEPGFIPDPKLVAFIKKARQDGKKIVYVGFGSVTVEDPVAMTRTIVESVLAAGVRCILSKGWSERGKPSSSAPNPTDTPADKIITNPHLLSPEIFQILSCPHDWLFQQIDAAVHHGGAGTTGASLRAGLPTVIKPFFGDQFFYATRVEDLGVGVALRKLNTTSFTKALVEVTGSERIVTRAKVLGEKIRAVSLYPTPWE
ncbi:hypothetical protein BZA77DRAFT_34549 [Pyronema omphalodes]|nr:hypothetical protein BZA77DRAFT_34549 [Pyronema omphalodes]